MRKYITASMLAFGLIIFSTAANAFDYKDWVPLLPQSISGMEQQGEAEGMNMAQGEQSWSTLRQEYADEDGKHIRLSIVAGSNSPGIKQFQTMQKFNMETEEKEVKTLEVSGYKAVLEFNKKGGQSNLLIAPQEQTLVIIDSTSFDNKKDFISLAENIPFSKIANAVN